MCFLINRKGFIYLFFFSLQVLEADDLLNGLEVVVLEVDQWYQVVEAEDGVGDVLQVAADELQLRQVGPEKVLKVI